MFPVVVMLNPPEVGDVEVIVRLEGTVSFSVAELMGVLPVLQN